jgi:hypothetical protein
MPFLNTAQVLLAPETQKALSLSTAAIIWGAVSQVDVLMEIVDRVCDPLFTGPVKTAGSGLASANSERIA